MGRDSGFIAANVALAVPDVNFCLIPEMDFDLDNPETQNGFLNLLEKRLERKKHAVVVVAEGAGLIKEGTVIRSKNMEEAK